MAKGKYHDWLTTDGLLRLEAWARDGLTDEQIAERCGINRKTIYDWKNRHPSICNALKKGKEVVDIEVENALLKRAMGYTYEEVTEERQVIGKDENGKIMTEMVVTRRVTKEVQPDVTAQIFWLKNRKPAAWRDRQQVDTNINTGGDFVLKIRPSDEAGD